MNIAVKTTPLNETNMYIVQDIRSRHGFLVDPCDEMEALRYIEDEEIVLDYIVLTHEHYDHIAALEQLRRKFPEAEVVASKQCSQRIQKASGNLSNVFNLILAFKKDNEPDKELYIEDVKPYQANAADVVFDGAFQMKWQGHQVQMWEAPGHSKGSILICVDNQHLFSGDTLSYDYELITGLPGGSKKDYREITLPLLQCFDSSIKVYPGHGRVFTLQEMPSF